MTTRAERLPVLSSRLGGFPWRQLLLSFLLTLVAVAVFALAFAVGYATIHAGRVLPGVQVGGISLSGLDRPSAEAALREQLPSLLSGHLTVEFADQQSRISYASIQRDYDMTTMLDQAFTIGHQGGAFVDQFQDQLAVLLNGVDITLQMGWNEQALEARLGELAAATYFEPIDARIVRDGPGWAVVPSVDGRTVDLSAGVQQALVAVDSLSAADAVVRVPATLIPPQVTTARAQVAVDRAEAIVGSDLTLSGGGTSETITSDMLRGWVRVDEAGVGEWSISLQREPVAQWVASVAAKTEQEPIEASLRFRDGVVAAVPGQTGQSVDVHSTTDAVYASLLARGDGGPPAPTINMAITVTEPDFTTEEAIAAAPRVEMVSSWTTGYTVYEGNNFGGNIEAPTTHLDGTVIEPGGNFDFWALMPASLSELPGVGPGGIIRRGRTVLDDAIGGGICSVSTTIFNAAARAGLELGARRNHSYFIDRYPIGLDATVWRTSSAQQNMTFVNDTEYPILIRSINSKGKVTFEIWSVPTGRTVEFSKPRVENRTPALDYYEYTDELNAGQTKRVEYPREGFESWVTRTVKDANGRVIHQETFYSKYRTIYGITLVGRGPIDPVAGTRVQR